jgi:hypothetical protein
MVGRQQGCAFESTTDTSTRLYAWKTTERFGSYFDHTISDSGHTTAPHPRMDQRASELFMPLLSTYVDADFLASRYRENGRLKPSQFTDHHKGQQVSLSIQGVRITSHIDSCIRFHINGYHLRQYLQKKRKWSDSTWETVNFDSFGRHFRRLFPSHQIAHMKLVHDQQPLGKRRHRIAPVKTESLKLCPCCMAAEEDQRHFLTCSSNSGRDHALKTFKKSMLGSDSHPVRYLIEEGIQNWINIHPTGINPQRDPSLSIFKTLFNLPSHLKTRLDGIMQSKISLADIGERLLVSL